MLSKRSKILAAALGIAVLVGALSFGPLVRSEAADAAARYGATLDIRHVWPTWGGARLVDIQVLIPDLPGTSIHLDEVRVTWGADGRRVAIQGALLRAVGDREVLLQQVEQWRAKWVTPSAPPPTSPPSHPSPSLDLGGFSLEWQDRPEVPQEGVRASGVTFERSPAGWSVRAAAASLFSGPLALQLADASVQATRDGALQRIRVLRLGTAEGTFTMPPEVSAPQPPADSPSAVPGPPASPKPKSPKSPAPPEPPPPWAPKVEHWANTLIRAASWLDATLTPDAVVEVDRVHAELRRGPDALHVGPGRLAVRRDEGRLVVELAPVSAPNPGGGAPNPPSEESSHALTFRLQVPVRPEVAHEETLLAIKGGPIGLATLGVRDGDFGLRQVAKTQVLMNAVFAISADHKTLRLDGDGRAQSLSLQQNALADEPIDGLDLAWRGAVRVGLDRHTIDVKDGELDLGKIRLLLDGHYESNGPEHRLRANWEVPLVGCQSMLESLPRGLVSRVADMQFAGTFAQKGKLSFDTARLDRDFRMDWDTQVSCRATSVPPSIDVVRFTKSFERTVYTPEGVPQPLTTGPGTPSWAPYGAISRFMTAAVLTTEDGGFYRHRGFDAEAIKNSVRENIRTRKFLRGASTLSMQLAKNLYLDRKKNVARKLQEAILTHYLEQALTKEQILELYLNVVELGPMIYGVGPAAQHHFRTDASQLSLSQAFYLSSILPNPKILHVTASGAVTPSWMSYLKKLMELSQKRNRITEDELEEGLRETVVRGSPVPIRAPKRDEPSPDAPPDDPDAPN